MEEKRGQDGDWEIVVESVYRRDRDDRLKRAYALVLPDIHISRELKKSGGNNGSNQHRPLRQSL